MSRLNFVQSTGYVKNKMLLPIPTTCSLRFLVPNEGSKKSQFWWDNIVMGTTSSNKKPLLTELWDKPFTKRPVSPNTIGKIHTYTHSIKIQLKKYILDSFHVK